MLTNRIVACLDVVNGMVTKAIKFQDNIPVAPAAEVMARLYADGIDEIIFFDINASAQGRPIDLATVRAVADCVFVPFTVGGGIRSLEDMYEVLKAGAEKISIDSMVVRNPELIQAGARAFGSQCVVVSMQAKLVGRSPAFPSGYEVMIDGARKCTGLDVVAWAQRAEALGAGELCVNSIDRDGTLSGFDIDLMQQISAAVSIPLIASGGAGELQHVADVFERTSASAAIVSSMLYSPRLPRNFPPEEFKSFLAARGIPVRPHVRGDAPLFKEHPHEFAVPS